MAGQFGEGLELFLNLCWLSQLSSSFLKPDVFEANFPKALWNFSKALWNLLHESSIKVSGRANAEFHSASDSVADRKANMRVLLVFILFCTAHAGPKAATCGTKEDGEAHLRNQAVRFSA